MEKDEELQKNVRLLEEETAKAFQKVKKAAKDVLLAPLAEGVSPDSRRNALYAQRNRVQNKADLVAIAEINARAAVAYEGLIDTDDFLHLDFFVKGISAAASVGQIRTKDGAVHGTGFLCAPGLIMTNNHVVQSSEIAEFFEIAFEVSGEETGSSTAAFAPGRFFFTSPKDKLDFTIIALEEEVGVMLSNRLGWHRLLIEQGKIALGRPVSIIQYPKDRGKQIVLHNSVLVHIADLSETETKRNIDPLNERHLWYTTDTKRGSSGSPVFNRNFEVIALHHAGVPRLKNGRYVSHDGKLLSDEEYAEQPDRVLYEANRGIRASRIVSALKNAKVEDFPSPEMMAGRDALIESWAQHDGQADFRQQMRKRIFGPGLGITHEGAEQPRRAAGLDGVLFEEIVRRIQDGSMRISFR